MGTLFNIIKGKCRRYIKESLCWHWFDTNVVFDSPPITHYDIKSCIKCGKSITVFKGNQQEWLDRHGLN